MIQRLIMMFACVVLPVAIAHAEVNDSCALTGQSSTGMGPVLHATQFTDVYEGYSDTGENIFPVIGRVLSTEPFLLEYLDSKTPIVSDHFFGEGMGDAVYSKERQDLQSLSINDMVSADLYTILDGSGPELGFASAMKNIKKIDGDIKYFNASPVGDMNRSGSVLIYYPYKTWEGKPPETGFSLEHLVIYNDGALFYQDHFYQPHRGKTISRAQLEDIMNTFAQVNFDRILPSETNLKTGQLTLICRRFQRVGLKDNTALKPLTDKLDALIEKTFQSDIKVQIRYESAQPYNDWKYTTPPLPKPKDTPGEKRVMLSPEDNKAWIKEYMGGNDTGGIIASGYANYRYQSKYYSVIFSNCGAMQEKAYHVCFASLPIVDDSTYPLVEPWPIELGIQLRDVPPGQAFDVPYEEYVAHRVFYESLLSGMGSSAWWWTDDAFLYRNVSVYALENKEVKGQ